MTKDPRVSLVQILERAERIRGFVEDGRAAFESDVKTQDAVIHNFAVIGEATRRIPDAWREQHPGIPWERLNAFRNVLIHQYDEVDLSQVWAAAENHLPKVVAAIRALLPPLDQLEREIGGEDDTDR